MLIEVARQGRCFALRLDEGTAVFEKRGRESWCYCAQPADGFRRARLCQEDHS